MVSDYRSVISSRSEAEIFIELSRLGHTIHVLSYPDAEYYNSRFEEFGITVIKQHPLKKRNKYWISYLRELIRIEKYDFVHAFNSLGLTNAIPAMKGQGGYLLAYRGYLGNIHWYDPTQWFKYFNARVDKIICLTNEHLKMFHSQMFWNKEKAVVIPKGHDPVWYSSVVPIERSSLSVPGDALWICMVANLRPFKGLPILLDAIKRVKSNQRVEYIFVGSGYDTAEVDTMFRQHPMRDHLHRIGFRKDSLAVIAACDGQVLASLKGEALTKSIIEGMCLRVPAVITNIPGNYGVVEDEKSGWVVPPGDAQAMAKAIEEMINNEGMRKERGNAAFEHIKENLHTLTTVEGFLNLYEELSRSEKRRFI